MILSDADIRARLESGELVIEPLDDPDLQIQPASVDLRLGDTFVVYQLAHVPVIDPRDPESVQRYTQEIEIEEGEAFVLHPGEFALGATLERVSIPPDLVARVEGRSSIGRLAVVVHASLPGDEELMVWTPDEGFALRPIGALVAERPDGLRAVSFDPDTLEVGLCEVTDFLENPPQSIFRVTLEDGRRVHLTRDHNLFTLDERGEVYKVATEDAVGERVLVPGRWPGAPQPTAELDLDATLASVSRVEGSWPPTLPVDEELGWVVGSYLAAGAIRGERLVFEGRGRLECVARWFRRRDARVTCHESGDGAVRVEVAGPLWSALLERLAGRGDDRHLPRTCWSWPEAALEGLLSGLLGGQQLAGTVEFAGEELAEQLLYLTARLGVRGARRERVVDGVRSTVVDIEPGEPGASDLRGVRVVEVARTGRHEPTYDLEVRPGGRTIENFLGGGGGIFLSNTAGFVDPGFEGRITLELSNLGRVAVSLYPGMRISQLVFHEMTSPAERPYGPERGSKYWGQEGPVTSRIGEDEG